MIYKLAHQEHFEDHRENEHSEDQRENQNVVGDVALTDLSPRDQQAASLRNLGQSFYALKNQVVATSWQDEMPPPMAGEKYYKAVPFQTSFCDYISDMGQCMCRYVTNKNTLEPYVVVKIDDEEFQSHGSGDMPENMCHVIYDDLVFEVPYANQKRLKISVYDVDIGIDRLIGKVYVDLRGPRFDETDFSEEKFSVQKITDDKQGFGGTVVFSLQQTNGMLYARVYRLEHIQQGMVWAGDEDGSVAWKSFIFGLAYVCVTAGVMAYIEDWEFPDALWFKIITVVGVGYGDMHPNTEVGMFVNTLMILCDLMLLGWTITNVAEYIINSATRKHPKWVERQHLFRILILAGFCFTNVLIAVIIFYVEEDWSFIQALHFCVVTLSTVGYGDISPTKTGTKIFCCFYILTIVISVARLLNEVVNYVSESGRDNQVHKAIEQNFRLIEILDSDGDGKISRYEYLSKMLVFCHRCTYDEIEQLMDAFNHVDESGDGFITVDEIKKRYMVKAHTQYHFSSAQDEMKEIEIGGGDSVSEDQNSSKRRAELGPSTSKENDFNHA